MNTTTLNLPRRLSNLLEIGSKYQNFFFDMDGVVWNGDDAIQSAVESINALQKQNKSVFFITNNSTKSRSQYVERLAKFGINIEKKFIFCASSIVADYVQTKLPEVKKCYVIGMEGILKELEEKNIPYIHSSEVHSGDSFVTVDEFKNSELDSTIGAVIMGTDYSFTYRKMCQASLYIQNGCHFLSTNKDKYIMVGGKMMPGGGCIVNALETACQQESIVTGKPNPFVVDMLCEQYNLNKEQCLMIGDNMETDIQLGINASIDTLLVLTGVTNEGKMQNTIEQKSINPTYYASNL